MAEPSLKMQIVKADQDLHDPNLTFYQQIMKTRPDKDRTLNHLTAIYDA
jgi:hypothetical protein